MRRLCRLALPVLAALWILGGPSFAQSKENGAIEGKVLTPDGELLPGVAVTATSPGLIGGKRVAVTNDRGRYRFGALPPGEYTLETTLEGFTSVRREGIRLSVGMTLAVDFPLQMGQIEEKIVVPGVPPMVDLKDSQTAAVTITHDLISHVPNNQFVTNIVNLAPGVSQDSAFGAADNGVQYQVDGVDVSDPELHTDYVFLDYGVVEEAQVMGIGAPAEYDGYSGIVLNTITKSGGNRISATFDSFLQPAAWNGRNSGDEALSSPQSALANVHFSLGGPFRQDKLWFFFAGQYCRSENQPAGFPGKTAYDQPRAFLKLTWQPATADRCSVFLEGDLYNGVNREADRYTDPAATRRQRSPELAFNLSYLHVFSDHTFLDAKFAGFTSYFKLIPASGYDVAGHYDYGTYRYSVNAPAYYHAYRTRYQLNSSLSHHVEDLVHGGHDFKLGVEVEVNPTRTEYGYSGGWRFFDMDGAPYLARRYDGYVTRATNLRTSVYLQDSWSFSDRLKINPGIRFNHYRGRLDACGTVFKPQLAIAPRLGLTFNLSGNHQTAFKVHWGRFFDNIITSLYASMNPDSDQVGYAFDPVAGQYVEAWRQQWNPSTYTMDPDIEMPAMDQFTVGLERELGPNVSVAVNYIHRRHRNLIDRVNVAGRFETRTYTDPETGREYTVANQLNPGENRWVITNPKQGQYPIVAFTPRREYAGIELVFNKRFANGWQLLASYVYSKSSGSSDNYFWDARSTSLGQSMLFTDPNYQINADGRLSFDPTHMVKLQWTVFLPLDVALSGYFSHISGDTYDRELAVSLAQDLVYILADGRGHYRLPARTNLDLRLEKTLGLGGKRCTLMLDCFNVFNANTPTAVLTYAGTGFQEAARLVNPRIFRAGVRVEF